MLTRKLTRRITQALTRKPTEPGSGGAAAFDPASLFASGEQGVWYDPSDFSTMFQDSAGTTPVTAVGQSVGRILDKSGRGNHATQADAAKKPLLQQDGNGKYYLAFDGDDFLITASINFSATDKMTVVAGVRVAGTGNQGLVATSLAGNNGSFNCLYQNGASPSPRGQLINNSAGSVVVTHGVPADTANAVHSFLFDHAGATESDEVKVRVNGALPTQLPNGSGPVGSGNFSASQPLYVGRYSDFFFNGRIYRMIVIGRTLSASDLAAAEAWCSAPFT